MQTKLTFPHILTQNIKIVKYFFLILIFLFSENAIAQDKISPYIIKERPRSDYNLINETCAVNFDFLHNRDAEKMKKEMGEDNFYITADDANFQYYEATQYLEKKKIKINNAASRYLIFVKQDGQEIYVDTKEINNAWILFDKDKGKIKLLASLEMINE